MTITAGLVKELREKTGVGMMDCKKALVENDGDLDAAVDWLRAKGLAKAAKKADRAATEGLISVKASGTSASIVEINSETDFVARNEQFQTLVSQVAEVALQTDGSLEAVQGADYPGTGNNVADEMISAVATIGENMNLRRVGKLSVNEGAIGAYVHSAVADGLGKIGVLTALESKADPAKLAELGKQIAMHIAATNPLALTAEEVDPEIVERERNVLSEKARESGKPENIIEKMIEGGMRKFFEESTLLKQVFVIDGENTIEQVLANASKDLGDEVKLTSFIRFGVGEGIEKEESNFAEEVAAASGVS